MTHRIATGQTVDWGNLPLHWQQVAASIDSLHQLWAREPDPAVLTARAFDERHSGGHRTYMEAHRYLSVAIDNHEALLALLQHHGATVWAPWSLIRPMFESSFYAAWALDPGEGRLRRERGLHLEVQDAKQERQYFQCFEHVPAVKKAVRAQLANNKARRDDVYEVEAISLGTDLATLQQPVGVFDGLLTLSPVRGKDRAFGAFLQATWRMLSGFEHGLLYAALRGSETSAEATVPGGRTVQMTTKDDELVNALKATYFLFLTAARLYERRCTRPD